MRFLKILFLRDLFENCCLNIFLLLLLLPWCTLFISNSSGELDFGVVGNNTALIKEVVQSSKFLQIIPTQFQCITNNFRHFNAAFKGNERQRKYSFQKSLHFIYYKNGTKLFQNSPGFETINQTHFYIAKSCMNHKISFIFHGWTESCFTEWVSQLQERLTFHRGGCIICVDYSYWSKKSYVELLQKFNAISEILYEEVLYLIQIGLNPSNIFMFGFSYGGQIASKIGRLLKPLYSIKKIDICDMAGPGFDFITHLNHSKAAENVQCYYSSLDKGSHSYSCHQNIRLGRCGYTQPAILSQRNFGSHGLCVRIYINMFDFPFYANRKNERFCGVAAAATNLSTEFRVGYKESGYEQTKGDIFVPTSLNYPYNLSKREIILYENYLEAT